VAWCHCESCRKHSRAPVSVFVAIERTAYTVTKGVITKFESTPGKTERGFCARCGSTLTCETVGLPTLTDFHVGAFDHAELFRPTRHIFPEERLRCHVSGGWRCLRGALLPLARLLMSSLFVWDGVVQLRNPGGHNISPALTYPRPISPCGS